MSDLSLYAITEEFQKLNQLLVQNQGEIDENQELILAELNELLQKKTDGVVGYQKKLKDQILIAKARRDEISDYVKALEKRKESFESYIYDCLENADHFSGELHKIKRRKPAKVLKITDKDKIPFEFLEIVKETKVLQSEIKKQLRSGASIDGAELVDSNKKSITISKA
jgi:predicted  nucleic acid-binding Zn-ribbon protein